MASAVASTNFFIYPPASLIKVEGDVLGRTAGVVTGLTEAEQGVSQPLINSTGHHGHPHYFWLSWGQLRSLTAATEPYGESAW